MITILSTPLKNISRAFSRVDTPLPIFHVERRPVQHNVRWIETLDQRRDNNWKLFLTLEGHTGVAVVSARGLDTYLNGVAISPMHLKAGIAKFFNVNTY